MDFVYSDSTGCPGFYQSATTAVTKHPLYILNDQPINPSLAWQAYCSL